MRRDELHKAVDAMMDRIDAWDRDPVGAAITIVHQGPRPGIDHATTEAEIKTLHHERVVVPLLGGVECLRDFVLTLLVDRAGAPKEGR